MSVLNTVAEFLDTEGVRYETDEDARVVRFYFTTEAAGWMVSVHHFSELQQLVVASHLPSVVPPELRPAVMEFATRINNELLVGNFDIDLDAGHVRYRTGIDLDELDVNAALVRNLIYANVWGMDLHSEGLNRVAYGGLDPEEAVALVRNAEADEDPSEPAAT